MERITSIEFDNTVSPKLAMEVVRLRGACAIRNFAGIGQMQTATELLRAQAMSLDENLTARVPRRQHMSMYDMHGTDTPAPLRELAQGVQAFVTAGDFAWTPNEIIGHRYGPTDFIGRHRDYTEAYGLVAVLTLDGMQDFYVELDDQADPAKVTMQPGTLTMLRGFTGKSEDRPYHWVGRPASQRTALSIRDMRHVWTPGPGSWT